MNPKEITLNRPGDNKTHLRADIRCKWTQFALKHFNTTIFWIPDGSPLHVKLRGTENLLAKIFIPIAVQTKEFIKLFVTPKTSSTLHKSEKQRLDDLLDYMDKNLGRFNEVSYINILRPCVLIFMTFELNIKCLWWHPATSNHLKTTRIEWSEVSDPIVITGHSLRQLQPGSWKVPIKLGTEELTNLLSALQEITKFPHFKNTHPLARHLVKELIRQCHSSVSDEQATSPEWSKINHN